MDKEQLISTLNSSYNYWENGNYTCQVCGVDIKADNWRIHVDYHVNDMNTWEHYFVEIEKLKALIK